jgi:hypothetical protein
VPIVARRPRSAGRRMPPSRMLISSTVTQRGMPLNFKAWTSGAAGILALVDQEEDTGRSGYSARTSLAG